MIHTNFTIYLENGNILHPTIECPEDELIPLLNGIHNAMADDNDGVVRFGMALVRISSIQAIEWNTVDMDDLK